MIFSLLRLWGIFALLSLSFSLFLSLTSFNIFKNTSKKAFLSFIPVLNMLVLLDIVKLSRYSFILLLLPALNILMIFYIMYRLSIIFNTNFYFALGLILLPVIFLPILNYSKLCSLKDKEEKVDSISLMTDEEINSINNKEDTLVDNVFKTKVQVKEEVPYFKANAVKYRNMMLDDESKEKTKQFEPVVINSIKNNKIIEEDDSIEIVEL